MNILIKGGTIVTAAETYEADILVKDGKIAQILKPGIAEEVWLLHAEKSGLSEEAQFLEIVDATGKLVMPGGIDVHTHMELPFFTTVSSDDFYTGQRSAAFGGTTCHIDFANQQKGETLHEALDGWRAKAAGKTVIDYGAHISITELRDDVYDEIDSMLDEGVTTLKLFLSYKDMYMLDDGAIFKIMKKAAKLGMLVMVHAENGDVVDTLIKENVAAGNLDPIYHALSHPAWSEAEATLRAIGLAQVAGASLYVVHMTCEESVDQVVYGRKHGLRVMGETCPQYLFATTDNLRQPDGAKWIFSPPVREKKDNEYLWKALGDGRLQTVATDHCPFLFDGSVPITYDGEVYESPGKDSGGGDFSKVPNGTHGIEDRLPMLWTYGVGAGHFSPNRFVELMSTNPAKIFGLYPQKGSIVPGADADIVIWDPNATKTIHWQTQHTRTDHNIYEGMELRGLPEKVFLRGKLLVDGENFYGVKGEGKFVKRRPFAEVV